MRGRIVQLRFLVQYVFSACGICSVRKEACGCGIVVEWLSVSKEVNLLPNDTSALTVTTTECAKGNRKNSPTEKNHV
jgi:hypothetical protein